MKNLARREVEAMQWPDYLEDREGDLLRQNEQFRRLFHFWCALALLELLVILAALVVLILYG